MNSPHKDESFMEVVETSMGVMKASMGNKDSFHERSAIFHGSSGQPSKAASKNFESEDFDGMFHWNLPWKLPLNRSFRKLTLLPWRLPCTVCVVFT